MFGLRFPEHTQEHTGSWYAATASQQTYPRLELLIGIDQDDGIGEKGSAESDAQATARIINGMMARDGGAARSRLERLLVYQHPANLGWIDNVNFLLRCRSICKAMLPLSWTTSAMLISA